MSDMKIGSASVPPGEKGVGYLKVGELAGGLDVKVPVVIVNGRKPEPVLWVNGSAHGNEISGIEVARRVYQALAPAKLEGTIIFTPMSNATALCSRRHSSPIDEIDLVYQTFPLKPEGSFSERVASTLYTEIISKADYLIDLHSLYESMNPYTVYSQVPDASPEVLRMSAELARVFGAGTICKVDLSEAAKYEVKGRENALDVFCDLHGIPSFMAEIGGAGAIEDRFVRVGESGLFNVMKYLHMIEGTPEIPSKQVLITSRKLIRSGSAGLVRVEVNPGDIVSKGSVIARIFNEVFEEREVIVASEQWYIIGVHNLECIVNSGDIVAFVGMAWSEVQ